MSELLDCFKCSAVATKRLEEDSGRIRVVCYECGQLLGLWELKSFRAPKSITLHGLNGSPQTIILARIDGMRVEDVAVVVDMPGRRYRFEFVSQDEATRQLEQLQTLFE